jgi:hypothetical protein
MPFRYVFDPISESFTMAQVGEIQVPPYWVNTSSPTVRKYIEKFGTPPKGMTTYEMKLALEEDERRQRQLAEEQFWTLIQLGEYTEAEQFAMENPQLGYPYANKASQLFMEHREKVRYEQWQKAKAGWLMDPYIQMALRETGYDPDEAYTNPVARALVEEKAMEQAKKYAEDYAQYGTSGLYGKHYLAIDRAYKQMEAMGLTGAYRVMQVHQKGKVARHGGLYPKEPKPKPQPQIIKDPVTGVAYEIYPDLTPISYELDPKTGYVVPVYADTGMAKQVEPSAYPDAYSSSSHKKSS